MCKEREESLNELLIRRDTSGLITHFYTDGIT